MLLKNVITLIMFSPLAMFFLKNSLEHITTIEIKIRFEVFEKVLNNMYKTQQYPYPPF